MDIHITHPDIEAKLTQSAAQQGRKVSGLFRAATLTSWYRTFWRNILTKRPALSPP